MVPTFILLSSDLRLVSPGERPHFIADTTITKHRSPVDLVVNIGFVSDACLRFSSHSLGTSLVVYVSGVDGTRLNNVWFLATKCKPLIQGLRLSIGYSRVWCADTQKETQPQELEGGCYGMFW